MSDTETGEPVDGTETPKPAAVKPTSMPQRPKTLFRNQKPATLNPKQEITLPRTLRGNPNGPLQPTPYILASNQQQPKHTRGLVIALSIVSSLLAVILLLIILAAVFLSGSFGVKIQLVTTSPETTITQPATPEPVVNSAPSATPVEQKPADTSDALESGDTETSDIQDTGE